MKAVAGLDGNGSRVGGAPTATLSTGGAKLGSRTAVSFAAVVARSVPAWLWALSLYSCVAVVAIGSGVLGDPARACACVGGADPANYMWSLAWWPHALLSGTNPLVTHAIWAPYGANVAAAATIPAAAIAMWPVTALFGVVVSYNVLAIAAPALAALTAFLLCRRITRRQAPSVLGGFIFGFSSYELAQSLGHTNLTLIFLLPVAVHLALRRIDGDLSRRRFIAALAVVLAVQALLSTELLLDAGLVGGAALMIAYFVGERSLRPRLDALAADSIIAAVCAATALLPYLMTALTQAEVPRSGFGLDLLNLGIPTPVTWLGGALAHNVSASFEGGNPAETDGYLGLPLLIAFGAFAVRTWRIRTTRILVLVFVCSLVFALGSSLRIAGDAIAPLPWKVLGDLPLFGSLLPSRIVVFADLVLAIAIASWLAQRTPRSGRRWLLALLGVAALLPNVAGAWWTSRPANPQFFRSGEYRRYLTRGQDVLVLPFAAQGESMLWQAETNFYFAMPGGYISEVTPARAALALAHDNLTGPFATQTGSLPLTIVRNLRAYLAATHIDHVIVQGEAQHAWAAVLHQLAGSPQSLGGILLYTVKNPA
jgi:hypothetical protein